MVVQVFIAEREGEHALADQGLDRVLEQSWVAPVGETAGHPTDQPEAAIQPPQQQPSGIRCDDSAIEPGHNLVPFNRFKFEQCWATLCLHRGLSGIAVSDWRIAIFRDSPPRCIKGFEKSGLAYKKSGAPVPTSTVHSILRNRLYTGWFEWNGKLYQGKHEPLVSVEIWERVQGVMDGRNASKHRRMTHDFAFSGLIACAKCGCSVVGEIKKQKYIYYHCTGYADKCRGEPASCRRKYVREEVLEQHFTALLGQLCFDDELLEWVGGALHASHADERREHEEAIKRLRVEYDRLQARIDAMYIDKLDSKIGGDFFDKMAGQWRDEQTRCLRDIERHQEAEQSYMDEGVRILELVRNAQSLFERQPAREKRRLLNFVLSNCTWEDGEVVATFRQPFDLLAKTNGAVARSKAGNGDHSSKNEIWLGDLDSNQD